MFFQHKVETGISLICFTSIPTLVRESNIFFFRNLKLSADGYLPQDYDFRIASG